MISRPVRRETRDPILALPAIGALQAMPAETGDAVVSVPADLARDADARADYAWHRSKAPMPANWKAVFGVCAAHRAHHRAGQRAHVT